MWNVHKFSKQAADNLGTKYKYILLHFCATSEILCYVDPIFCHFSSYQFHAKEREIHAINVTQLWMKHSLVTNTHRNESHHARVHWNASHTMLSQILITKHIMTNWYHCILVGGSSYVLLMT
jgi:hypothetical protein